MLLVAMLALGTATYAWFSVNKSVYADGMQVTASAPKGLQVTIKNGAASDAATSTNWASTMSYTASQQANVAAVSIPWTNANKKLPANYFYPKTVKDGASSANAILAADASNSAKFDEWQSKNTYPTITSASGSYAYGDVTDDNVTYLVAYTVGVRSTDNIASTTITAKLELTGTGNKYVKAAVIDNANASNITLTGGTTAIKEVYADADTSWNAITATTPAAAAVGTVKASATTWTFTGLNGCGESTSKAQYYTILMWVEGQDADCYDANPSLSGACKLTFSYV